MKLIFVFLSAMVFGSLSSPAQLPDNLVADGVPTIPAALKENAGRYLEFRAAIFAGWHPVKSQMLILTRFADTAQLHLVKMPGGARNQLTYSAEPVSGAAFRPKTGDCIVLVQDSGGGEFYQLYRFDVVTGKITLLTDGKSRNGGPHWSHSGKWLAYTSTRRNGKDNDLYLMDPADPKTDRLLLQVEGGGWQIADWSADDSKLVLIEYISVNESYLWLLDANSGKKELLTPKGGEKISWSDAGFAHDRKSLFVVTDKDSEFQRLGRFDLATKKFTPLTAHIPWDVEDLAVSPDGRTIAFLVDEDGVGVLHLANARNGKEIAAPKIPAGIPSNLKWHENGRNLGFNLNSARSSMDVYSVNVESGKVERWTESETGGLDPSHFAEPQLIKLKSFDGLPVSGFVYRPDPAKFPGKRPVLINIHGGPEGQSRPGFQGRYNYFLNEMGVAILYPNVRGSSGYGKTFLTLDNGFKREDSVKDIAAFIDWIKRQPELDADRIAVIGGSYGGYMSLACMEHYNDQLRCGIDIVGISNFISFLKNTQDYRRDLRRVEYGDERDPAMHAFLEKISPTTNSKQIKKPLFVVQGKNDPRVNVTESENMVKAIRDNGGQVWYLMAKDEGHGFAKKKNADYQFLATILFIQQFLTQ
jgi:dipeptidyl aminopeptidase/acylaminoacyl peptidase